MTELRTRLPHVHARRLLVAGIVGITGLIGFRRAFNRRNHRPTGEQLGKMSDVDFASFVSAAGLKTVTSARSTPIEGNAD